MTDATREIIWRIRPDWRERWEAGERYQTQAEITEQDARVRVAMEHLRELKK